MEQNKTRSYIYYAIGEIVLVMIGILLALQVNNWNEERVERQKEVKILHSLKTELISSREELRSDSTTNMESWLATHRVHDYITENSEFQDSLLIDFYRSVTFNNTFPTTIAYEALKAQGLDLIKNDSLLELLAGVYELGYKRILTKEDTRRNSHKVLFPYYQQHFRTVLPTERSRFDDTYAEPNDLNFIREEAEFQTLVALAMAGRANRASDFRRTLRSIDETLSAIDEYLKEF